MNAPGAPHAGRTATPDCSGQLLVELRAIALGFAELEVVLMALRDADSV